MTDSIETAERWLRASGIPVHGHEIRAWLDARDIPVMMGVWPLFAAVRQAVIAAGDAGHAAGVAAGRRQAAAELRAYALNYPESVFPPDSDSRDAIGGTAMRHAYNNAARIAEGAPAEPVEETDRG